MAFLELNPELEGFARRLELEDEGPGPLWTCSLLPAFATRLIACQPSLQNALKHLVHFLFVGLARNLQQQRFGHNSMIDALSAQQIGDASQRERFRHRRTWPPDFLRDVFV